MPITCLTLFAPSMLSRVLPPHKYQRVIATCCTSFVFTFTQVAPALESLSSSNVEGFFEVNPRTWRRMDRAVSKEGVASFAAWQNEMVNLFLMGIGCTLGLEPIAAGLTMLACGAMMHDRAQTMSRDFYDVEFPAFIIIHGLSVVVLLFSCYVQAKLKRRARARPASHR